jgi:hypothetical protein
MNNKINDYVKNIENTELESELNLPDDFGIKDFDTMIENSFQKFLKSNDFENLDDNKTRDDIQEEFNKRLNENLDKLDEIENSEIDNVVKETSFELQNFDTKICLKDLSTEAELNPEEEDLDIKTEEDLKKVFKKIEDSESFDPNSEKVLKDYIENKERFWAIKEIFNILWRLFKINNTTWFSEFSNLSGDIRNLDLDNKTIEELSSMIKEFEAQIEKTWDIKKDLKLTYILSEIKNKKLLKEDPNLDKKELLQKNLEIGDVILLNKKVDKLDIWSKALKAYDKKYETDFTHSAIIIATDPVKIRHSTTFTQKKVGKGHVEEVDLYSYLKQSWTKSFDLLALRPDENTKQKILEFSESNLWKEYDNNAALWWWLFWIDSAWPKARWWLKRNKTWEKDDMYNCVEIIAQALDQDKLKDITHPNEFLEYMNIFQPTYMTTIVL